MCNTILLWNIFKFNKDLITSDLEATRAKLLHLIEANIWEGF